MNIFKLCTSENVRNCQTTSKEFFSNVYSLIFSSSAPQKMFERAKWLQRIFFQVVFMNILKSAPKKIFEIVEQLQRIFSRVHLKIVF